MTCQHKNTQFSEESRNLRKETCVNCGASRWIEWPSAVPDCITCGGWGTLLRDGQRVQCECSETKGTK